MYSNESSIVSNLMMKFSNVPSFASSVTATTTESTSQPTPVFSAPSSSTSQRAAEERRNRKLKRQEKTKHQKPHQQSQKPQAISVPEVPVIPLDDEYEHKKQKRLLRNRQAAQQSRERKKQKIMQLEEEMGRVMEENSSLRYRVQQLEALLKGNSIFTSPSPETSAASVSSSGHLSFDSCSQDEVLQYDELNTPVTESPSSPGFLNQESPENHDVSSFTPLASSDECLWPSDFFVQSPQETLQYLQNLQNLPQQHLQRDQQQQQTLQCLLEDEQQQRQFGISQQEQQIEEEQRTQACSSESAALSSFSLPMEEAQVLSTIQSTPVLQVICFLISLSWIQLSVLQFAAEQTNGSSSVVAEQQDPQEEQTSSQSEQSTSASSSNEDTLASVARRPKSRWKLAQQQLQFALDCGRGSSNLALPVLVNTLSVC